MLDLMFPYGSFYLQYCTGITVLKILVYTHPVACTYIVTYTYAYTVSIQRPVAMIKNE